MDAARFAAGQEAANGLPFGSSGQPSRQIADLASAIEIMRQLNPQCDNDECMFIRVDFVNSLSVLYRMLTAHINGEPLELTADEIVAAGGRQILVPLPNAVNEELGFKVKHTFRISHSSAAPLDRECACVQVVESPEVLAVHDLFSPDELTYLQTSVQELTFERALSTTIKVRVEGEQDTHEFVVPNDADDMCLSSPTAPLTQRNCEVAFIDRESHLYKIVAARLRAVLPRECPGTVQDIVVERYLPGRFYEQGHLSHQRFGAVLVPLETLPDGGLSLISIGLQLTPLAGMGIWLPARFEAPVPDLRTDFAVQNPNSVPLHYIVAWIVAKTDHKEVVQGDSVASSTDDGEIPPDEVEVEEDEISEDSETSQCGG